MFLSHNRQQKPHEALLAEAKHLIQEANTAKKKYSANIIYISWVIGMLVFHLMRICYKYEDSKVGNASVGLMLSIQTYFNIKPQINCLHNAWNIIMNGWPMLCSNPINNPNPNNPLLSCQPKQHYMIKAKSNKQNINSDILFSRDALRFRQPKYLVEIHLVNQRRFIRTSLNNAFCTQRG